MSVSVDQSLQEAIRDFQGILTPDQNKQLLTIRVVPDATAVITFTAQLDSVNAQRKGYSIASRLYSVLQSVQQFSTVVETFVSSHPNIAALVWGSVKLTMLIVSNFTSYFDRLSFVFMKFNKLCPRFKEWQLLYPQSTRLQSALCTFHASIIRCCKQAVLIIQRPWSQQVVNAISQSFEGELEPFQNDILAGSKDVEKEILLAKAQAHSQEYQLQRAEQEAAAKHRKLSELFFHGAEKEKKKFCDWRIQVDDRKSKERTQQLLDSLSSYDHLAAFKQARKKRHGSTAQWLTMTPEFDRWIDGTGSPMLCCFGKLGSGKTVLTANVIDFLILNKTSTDARVAFFFCRFDEALSLRAETIIRCIIRQLLDAGKLSRDTESCLERISQDPLCSTEELEKLLQQQTALARAYFILIDGLDECEKSERDIVLQNLQSMISARQSKVKIFLASRNSTGEEIRKRFPFLQYVSLDCPQARSDIKTFVREILDFKLNNGDLVVGNQDLVKEIQEALIQGAQGMFLWVAFQIEDICSQISDHEIRKVLKSLPKDLPETFNRALFRIVRNRKEKIAQQVFRWVATAARPLTLEELREGIVTEPGQPYSEPERLINDFGRVTSWCQNLVVVDEEDDVVQFAHHSVKQFLTGSPSEKQLCEFHFKLPEADHELGEICVTYLHFNDFKTQLMRLPQSRTAITPDEILATALGRGSKSTMAASLLQSVVRKAPRPVDAIDVTQKLGSYRGGSGIFQETFQQTHPFLAYASQNWLFHSTRFDQKLSKTWNLWTRTLYEENSLGQRPWTNEEFVERNRIVGQWICDLHHTTLLRLIENSDRTFSAEDRTFLMQYISEKGDMLLLGVFLEAGHFRALDLLVALQAAAKGGHLKVVEELLAAKTNVNAPPASSNGWTALQAAAEGGHLEVVERLLAVKAKVNAPPASSNGRTALQAAAGGGHLEVVKKLLAAKANVNAPPARSYGRTALQAAAGGGHLEMVDKLLTAKADINAPPAEYYGRMAIQAAAEGGHLEVVDKLLAAKAYINTPPGKYGRTALQAAAERGHLEVVDKLLAAKADINAPPAGSYGRTALQAAAEGGHLEVVDKLLAAYADINAPPAGWKGRTALQAAAGRGHLEMVDKLLTAKADINAPPAGYYGRTALQAAAEGGHLEVVDKLLVAKANINAPPAKYGQTALQVAAEGGHLKVVDKLLAAKADINTPPAVEFGRTALQAAAGRGHLEVVDKLLAAKADINAPPAGYYGRTALQAAAGGGHLEMVDKLLAAKADINAPPARWGGRTALQAAAGGGHLEVVDKPLAAKADINAPPAEDGGRTALQAAAGGGHLEVVDKLLAAKADINAPPARWDGRTALQAAAEGGHLEIVDKLLAAKADIKAPPAESHGRTALQAAIQGGHVQVEARLRSAGTA